MRGADLWLGVDAGETNTDAVVMDTRHHLVAKAKVSTTADVRSGIGTAISRAVAVDQDPAVRIGGRQLAEPVVDALVEVVA